jgi:hypothetical protein
LYKKIYAPTKFCTAGNCSIDTAAAGLRFGLDRFDYFPPTFHPYLDCLQ